MSVLEKGQRYRGTFEGAAVTGRALWLIGHGRFDGQMCLSVHPHGIWAPEQDVEILEVLPDAEAD